MLTRISRVVGIAMLALLPVLAVQVGLGSLVDSRPEIALLVALAFVGVVLMFTAPGLFLLAALPATYLYVRVGPASTDISGADVALAVAIVVAIPLVPWSSARLQSMLRLLAAYLLMLVIVVIAVPSQRAAVEWGHRAFLVAGGLFVGAAIVATGRARAALRLYVLTSVVVAIAAVVDAIAHPGTGLFPEPAYPFGIQKNTAGLLIGFALIVVVAGSRWLELPRLARMSAAVLLIVGVLACQARGPALAVALVLAVWAIQASRVRITPVLVVGGMLLIALTYVTVNASFHSDATDSRFNSVNSRVATYDAALDLWRGDPLVGVGLKFWRNPTYSGDTAFGEPHDLAVSALGESGVIGLVALSVLAVGSLILLVRKPSEFAGLAVMVVLTKTAASVVDIYWVAGTLTFMWMIVGFACAPDRLKQAGSRRLAQSASR